MMMWKIRPQSVTILIVVLLLCVSFLPFPSQAARGECQAGSSEGECAMRGSDTDTDESHSESDSDDQEEEPKAEVWKIPPNPLGKARAAALKAQQGEGTRIVSNFIQNATVLEELTDHELWFQCYEETRGKTTHWLDRNSVPTTWYEKLAVTMWNNQPILQNEHKDFAGYEIWCNIITPQGPLSWHVDKDQIAYTESDGQNLSLPLYGSVFYGYPHDFRGGYLEIIEMDSLSDEDDAPPTNEVERIAAEYNRLVVFNASKYHRVAPVYDGTRLTLAVNVWKGRPQVANIDEATRIKLREEFIQ